ncbi:MAG: M13 family metallopeptidase [Steroidobacteraceae bacterium]|jgi:putative endopeptidase
MSTRPDGGRSFIVPRGASLKAAALLVLAAAGALGASSAACASDDGLYLGWMDRSVAPGADFFRFANGGWIKTHPIPPDRSYWGVDTILEQENQTFIRDLVESLGKEDWPAGTSQRKVADFYLSGMDERAIEAAGAGPLEPELGRIAAIRTSIDLQEEIAHLQTIGVSAPLSLGQMQDFNDSTRVIALVAQSGLGLPNRDYYLKSEPTFKAARAAYLEHVARMLVLLGDAPVSAGRESKTILEMETRLADASMSDVEQRDPHAVYHPMSLDRAQAVTPHFDWHQLLKLAGHPEIGSLNVGMPEFFRAVDRELVHTSIEDWKTYLRWQLLDTFAPFLSRRFVDEDFRMTSALTGAQELQARWLRVLRAEDQAIGFAIGQIYVAQRFPPAAKQAATAIVERVRDALRTDLATLTWMTPATRAAAAAKLDLMQLRVGYPDQWRDYSGLAIDRGPYVLNVMRANAFEFNRQLAKVGKPVDRSEWYMTPQTVNAYYDPSMNSLNVPAGILRPPYFDANWPDAVNYGATGATVGHEMTHGFDDEGAQFDGHGNLKDWWAPADLAKFHAATRCISDQYSRFTVGGGLHVQGDLVTGEATADLGGLMLAWRAMHSAPAAKALPVPGGYTPDQMFFIAFAHSWASAIRPRQAEEMVTTDPHPPADDRTNATLANSPDFQRAFAITSPAPMVKRDRCVIW